MGMYDYIGGEQIKIFYTPIFMVEDEKPVTWHSGGSLTGYDEESDLPLHTLYYQYPADFMVYDYRDEERLIWIFRNEKFVRLTTLSELKEEDVVGTVYTYHGNELTIASRQDFEQIVVDEEERFKGLKNSEKQIFPEGYRISIETIQQEGFEENQQALHKLYREVNERFSTKWLAQTPDRDLKNFGEALDVYSFHLMGKDEKPSAGYEPKKLYSACRRYVQDLMEQDNTLVERYVAWLKDEELKKEALLLIQHAKEAEKAHES